MAAGPGYYDADGVWHYGETTPAGPLFSDFLNLLASSVSTVIVAAKARLTAIEAKLTDTGWITPALSAGWTPLAGDPPMYRRKFGVIYMKGNATSSAAGTTLYNLPAGYRPLTRSLFPTMAGASATAVTRIAVEVNGDVIGQVSSSPHFSGVRFTADA